MYSPIFVFYYMTNDLYEHLQKFVTLKRLKKFEEVLKNRTKYLTIVLEDIYQSQNASAVLRSCDCFGIQNVNVIENKNVFDVNVDVAMGASKWLNVKKYNKEQNNTLEAIKQLKTQGYRIVATSPHVLDNTIETLNVENGKIALVFGTELTGISDLVRENADEFVKIPMYGFTESFNISVCAALSLYELTKRIHNSTLPWQLSEEEKMLIKVEWLKRSIKSSDDIVRRFLDTN